MRSADCDILILPGWSGSGPDHWQSRWVAKLPSARVVEQDDWHKPVLDSWSARLIEAIASGTRPQVLVGHSLGCITVAHAAPALVAQGLAGKVAGALLVAPPSEKAVRAIPGMDPAFAPFPRQPLPFRTLVVSSSNDPYCPQAEAKALAESWGATYADAGESGHLNAASGHGPWPEGLMTFAGFLKGL